MIVDDYKIKLEVIKLAIMKHTGREINEELLTGIMNMFLHYYPKVDFEDDDYIKNLNLHIYNSKETTEEKKVKE